MSCWSGSASCSPRTPPRCCCWTRSARYLVATAARGIEEEVRQGVRIPLGRGFAGRIAAEKRAVFLERVDHTNVLNPILRDKGIHSLLGVPLLVGGTVLGVLHVGTLCPRQFSADDTDLLQLVADRIALAVHARSTQVERAAASALQRSLLPTALPEIAGFEFAARYVPGGYGQVGGDWYDVFSLPSGSLCIVVGDVVGRGLSAAVEMGRLRQRAARLRARHRRSRRAAASPRSTGAPVRARGHGHRPVRDHGPLRAADAAVDRRPPAAGGVRRRRSARCASRPARRSSGRGRSRAPTPHQRDCAAAGHRGVPVHRWPDRTPGTLAHRWPRPSPPGRCSPARPSRCAPR